MSNSPTTAQAPHYTVHRADLVADRQAILEIWQQHQISDPSPRFEWLYGSRAHGPAWCLLLRDPAGRLVGSTGLVQRLFHHCSGWIRGGHTIDLVIDRTHRSAGPAIQLQRALAAGDVEVPVDFLYGTPIRPAELIQRRVNFQLLDSLHRWTKPLRWADLLRDHIPARLVCNLAGRILDVTSALLFGESWRYLSKGWFTTFTLDFDSRFDNLWAEAKNQYEIIGDRSAAYLSWRFGPQAPTSYRTFTLTTAAGALLGYVIFTQHGSTTNISDLLARRIPLLHPLLLAFSRQIRSEGASNIGLTCITPPSVATQIRRSGFFRRPEKANVVIHINGPKAAAFPALTHSEDWFLTDADRDV